MAEDIRERPPRRRRRWLVAALLLGTGVWAVRTRRSAPVDLGDPWPARQARPAAAPVRDAPVPPVPPVPPRTDTSAGHAPIFAAPAPAPAGVRALLDTASASTVPASARPSPRPRRQVPAGGAVALPDGSPPGAEYTIKGNAGSMLFHPPTSPYFARTKAEFWFRTAEDARAAGFTEWTPKKRV